MYLLDTNVLSEVLKKRPARSVQRRLSGIPLRHLHTSAVCVMELRFGAMQRRDGEALWARIRSEVLDRVRVLRFGSAEAERAADLLAALESKGEPIGLEDVMISATALESDLVVVSRNLRHLERVPGLRVESWWTA